MPDVIAELVATVGADISGLTSGLQKAMDQLGNVGQKMTMVLTGPILAFGAASVKAASDEETVLAQLSAVLRSTGSIAGVTAKQVTDLAQSFSEDTRFSKDAVISAENLLLTFTNINKNVFPETTQVVLDMSQALGQDLKSSAIQLGKALQDPEKGISALKRVGVNFTESQKTMIAGMAKAGNVMGAQKLILEELRREFGGSAQAAGDTFAGKLDILNHAFTGIQVKIGNIIIPILTKFIGSISNIVDWLGKLSPQTIEIGIAAAATVAAIGPLLSIISGVGTVVGFLVSGPIGLLVLALGALGVAFATNFGGIRDLVMPIFQRIGDAVGLFMAQLGDFVSNVQKFGLAKALESALNLGDGKKYVTGWIEGVLIALGVGKENAMVIVSDLSRALVGNFSGIGDLLSKVWADVAPKISTAVGDLIKNVGQFVNDNAPQVIAGFVNVMGSVANWFSQSAWPQIQTSVSAFFSALGQWVSQSAWPWVVTNFNAFIASMGDWLGSDAPGNLFNGLAKLFAGIGNWVTGNGWNGVKLGAGNMFDSFSHWLDSDAVGHLYNGLEKFIQNLVQWFNTHGWPEFVTAIQNSLSDRLKQMVSDMLKPGKGSIIDNLNNQGIGTIPAASIMPTANGILNNAGAIAGGPAGIIGGLINSVIGGIFGGGRASGGPVKAGTPYVVGERRPELFVPSTNGNIVPSLGGGGNGMLHVALSLDGMVEHVYLNIADALKG